MISVVRDEIQYRFAGIPAVLWTLHELYHAITCEKFHSGKAESLFCTAGTKFFQVIASARLNGMKKLTSAYKEKKKENVYKSTVIPGENLSRLVGMKFDLSL